MKRQARQVVAVVMVATALCADRAAVAATPAVRAHTQGQSRVVQLAGRIVGRLTASFRRPVQIELAVEPRHRGGLYQAQAHAASAPALVAGCLLSACELRLPPPTA